MAELPINYGDTGKVARDKINESFEALESTVAGYRPHIESGIRWIGDTNTGVKAEGDSIVMKAEDGYIWYKSESNSWTQIIAIADLKGEQGNPGADGNGIASITTTKIGKTTTVVITETDGNVDTFNIQDGADGSGGGDVEGPESTTSGNIAVFDGTTGKKIKDGGALGTAATKNTGTSSGNVPVLDSNGKLATSTIPGVALTDTFTVSTSSDLTSLSSAEQGDIAIATSENKTYVLSQAPYSTAANWKEILAPTGGVTSVNGQTGAVTIDVPNTKTFYLSGILDLTTAQAAYDWYVAGKNPIIISGNLAYNLLRAYSDSIAFYSKSQEIVYQNTRTMIGQSVIQFEITSGTVTEINMSYGNVIGSYLDTETNYSTPYTPTYAGSPATKKYVDDKSAYVGSSAPATPTQGQLWYDTTNDVLKTYDGTNWNECGGGGDVLVSSQANNIFTPGMKIWGGTESDYQSLTPDSNTAYLLLADQPTPPSPWTPGANTVAYYPLTTDMNDYSGNSYNVTDAKNTQLGNYQGVDCLNFNNSFCVVGSIDGLQADDNYTMSFWAYRTGWINIQFSESGAWGGSGPSLRSNANEIRWGNATNMYTSFSNSITPSGTWLYVVVVVDNGEGAIYVNNQKTTLVASGIIAPSNNGGTLYIGGLSDGSSTYPSDGYISNLIIENKARTSQEISDYYDQTKANYGIS